MDLKNIALVTGDLHLRPSTLDSNQLILSTILNNVRSRSPKFLAINGDIFHTKNETYESVKSQFRNFLKEVTKLTDVILVVGNHDWAREHTIHSLEDFSLLERVTVVASGYKFSNEIGFMAYSRTEERFEENLQIVRGCKLIFGHFAINQFDLGSGYEEVDLWCNPDRFNGIEKVISGHWHKSQRKNISNVEFLYVGSPATVGHGESNQRKYFAIVNLDTFEDELVDTELTLHKTIRVEAGDEWPEIPSDEIRKGIDYRIIIRGTKEQLSKIKIPKGYNAEISQDVIASNDKREIIDAYSGPLVVIDTYVDKKRESIRKSLISSGLLSGESSNEDLNRIITRLKERGKILTGN